MYESFYGLAARPFELTPNPRYLFLSTSHAEALTTLEYAWVRHGLTLLIGDAGTGKTTLVYAALQAQRRDTTLSVLLTNPALARDEFFDYLAFGFGLSRDAAGSKSRCLRELSQSLAERHAAGTASALIIDEAQSLSDALLEEIRLLGNIETPTERLLSIILIGQPELADRLNAPAMRQLKQRVSLRCTLSPLDLAETAAYISTRIRVAGGDGATVFAPEAIEGIYRASGGVPRVVSVICDNALITGFALKQRPVGTEVVDEVCRDLGIEPVSDDETAVSAAAVPPQRFSFF